MSKEKSPKTLPDLSDAEWIIMRKVWALKRTSVREVFELLHDAHGWAYNTVRTMMERMRQKGYLSASKVGNMHFYEPAASRRRAVIEAIEDFAEKVFDGSVGSIVSYLIGQGKLSESEMREIQALLKEQKEKGKKEKGQ